MRLKRALSALPGVRSIPDPVGQASGSATCSQCEGTIRKGRDIVGKPVVSLEDGARVASVKNLVADQDKNLLFGFVVNDGGWFSAAKILHFSAVKLIGEDAVVTLNAQEIRPADSLSNVDGIVRRKNLVGDTTLMTWGGRDRGRLADLFVDETSGAVTGYEVTGGVFTDLNNGRSFVPAPDAITVGGDLAFVPPETAAAMEEQEPGGSNGALNTAQSWVQSAGGKVGEVAGEHAKSLAVGKVASHDVTAPDGAPIAMKGDTVTEANVAAAEDKGCLPLLTAVASLSAAQAATSLVGDHLGSSALEATRGRRVRRKVCAEGGALVAAQGQVVTDPVEADLIAAVSGAPAQDAQANVAGATSNLRDSAVNLLDRARKAVAETRDRTVVAAKIGASRPASAARLCASLLTPATQLSSTTVSSSPTGRWTKPGTQAPWTCCLTVSR